jgi:hypothetical protein
MQDVIAYLVGFFLLEPLEARLAEKLQAAKVPKNIIAQVQDCARTDAPALVERVMSDPLWGAQAAVRVWTGTTSPAVILADALPGCRPAIEAAEPFLRGGAV